MCKENRVTKGREEGGQKNEREKKKKIKEKESMEEEKNKEELRAIGGRIKKVKAAKKGRIPNKTWINEEELLDAMDKCIENIWEDGGIPKE